MDYNDVSFKSVPTDEECIVNAVQIGKIINEPPHTIRSWASEFEDYLYIKKMNGRFLYTQKSIEQFEFIKTLRREKNFSIEQIRQQLKLTGYNSEETGLVTNDINFIESVSTDVAIKLKNELGGFITELFNTQNESIQKYITSIKTEVEETVQEQLEVSEKKLQNKIQEQTNTIQENINSNNENILKRLQDQEEQNKKLLECMDSIQKEVAITKEMNEKMDKMRQSMDERKAEIEKPKEKSIWSKLFSK